MWRQQWTDSCRPGSCHLQSLVAANDSVDMHLAGTTSFPYKPFRGQPAAA